MLSFKSRDPLRQSGYAMSNVVRYRVGFDAVTPVMSLFQSCKLIDSRNHKEIRGQVCGVECSQRQDREGIQAGDRVVIAIHTG